MLSLLAALSFPMDGATTMTMAFSPLIYTLDLFNFPHEAATAAIHNRLSKQVSFAGNNLLTAQLPISAPPGRLLRFVTPDPDPSQQMIDKKRGRDATGQKRDNGHKRLCIQPIPSYFATPHRHTFSVSSPSSQPSIVGFWLLVAVSLFLLSGFPWHERHVLFFSFLLF